MNKETRGGFSTEAPHSKYRLNMIPSLTTPEHYIDTNTEGNNKITWNLKRTSDTIDTVIGAMTLLIDALMQNKWTTKIY